MGKDLKVQISLISGCMVQWQREKIYSHLVLFAVNFGLH